MQRTLLILSLVLAINIGIAQDSGIQFSDKTWNEILVEAKESNKLIFMDAYTTWCGPCKIMSKKVFPLEEVGEFYNDNFINVKRDMEKGEGVELAVLYKVAAYPTLLYIDGDGKLVHRGVGYQAAPDLIQLGQDASNPATQLSTLDKKYANGDKSPEFLKIYLKIKAAQYDGSHTAILEEYLDTQDDWSHPEHIDMIFNYSTSAFSETFDYMRENQALFAERHGAETVNKRIQTLMSQAMGSVDPSAPLDVSLAKLKKLDPENYEQNSYRLKMSYYRQNGDRTGYANSAVEYTDNVDIKSWEELNDMSWTFYRVIEDTNLLKKATKWAKKSTELDHNPYNTDTLAALYYKLGKKKKALKYANEAIALGEGTGVDMTGTIELIEKINAL
jgi:thiol-disulfide isomerase/thioredoxin